jgi:hypothetical protein
VDLGQPGGERWKWWRLVFPMRGGSGCFQRDVEVERALEEGRERDEMAAATGVEGGGIWWSPELGRLTAWKGKSTGKAQVISRYFHTDWRLAIRGRWGPSHCSVVSVVAGPSNTARAWQRRTMDCFDPPGDHKHFPMEKPTDIVRLDWLRNPARQTRV